MKRRPRAFTLIELLLVIAIIALLIAMLLQGAGMIRESLNRARCQTQLRGLYTAYMAYVSTISEGNRFPPLWSEGEYGGGGYASWYFPQHDYRVVIYGTYRANFGPLVWHRMVTDSDIFMCPAIIDSGFQWWHDGTLPDHPDNFWSSRSGNQDPIKAFEDYNLTGTHDTEHSRACYGIRPYLYPWTRGKVEAEGVKAVMADNFNVPECVLERHVTGVNVAFLDGSVRFVEDPDLWDNALSWSFMANDPRVLRIWEKLDTY